MCLSMFPPRGEGQANGGIRQFVKFEVKFLVKFPRVGIVWQSNPKGITQPPSVGKL